MSKSENTQDQLERMLDKWGQQLPEAPAQLVTNTLNQIQVSKSRKGRNWFAVAVLGGMVAASLVVVAGLVVMAGADKTAIPAATQVAAVSVATPTTGNAEVANPVSTSDVTAAPTAPPTATQVVTAKAVTPNETQPTIELIGPTPASLEPTFAPIQPTVAPATATQPDAVPPTSVPAAHPTATLVPQATVAPVETTKATQTKKPAGPIAVFPPGDGVPTSVAPVQPNPTDGRVTLSGRILTLEASALILSSNPERILFNSSTSVTINGLTTTIGSLQAGQTATVVANRNAQGQLVASSIAIVPNTPKRG